MRRRFDDILSARYTQAEEKAPDMLDWGTMCDADQSFECYEVWCMSGHVVLPYPGGWLDQPKWVRIDFLHWMRLDQWHKINAKRLPPPDRRDAPPPPLPGQHL